MGWVLGLIAAALLAVAMLVGASKALEVPQVRVNELQVPRAALPAWALEYRQRWAATEITLLIGDRAYRRPRSVLGADLSVDRLEEIPSESFSIRWAPEVDSARLLEAIAELRQEFRIDRSARGDSDRRSNIDLHASMQLLKTELRSSTLLVELPIRRITTIHDLGIDPKLLSFSTSLGRHKSKYRTKGKSRGRARNIELAANFLDGVVIAPGEEFSFNEVVGARSFMGGFQPGPEIREGKVVDGIGGGICQVATALHEAALYAAFDIIEHYPHSKRPKYASLGTDSAVAWGHKDLRIRNTLPDFVRVRADAGSGVLIVELRADRQRIEVIIDAKVVQGSLKDRHSPLKIKRIRTVQWPSGPVTDETTLRYAAEKPKPG